MSGLGGHPILSMGFDATVAASMGGTAASTVLNSSFPVVNARYMQIYNFTARDMEIIFQSGDQGTAYTNMVFVPALSASCSSVQLLPINMQQGGQIRARTTTNVPLTVSSTLALRINFWA